jgi:hypothetical protein
MMKKLARLFVIRNRFEAWAVIYALAAGASARGVHYLQLYPGLGGKLLFLACTGAVFMAGAKLLDSTRPAAIRRTTLSRVVTRARANCW